MRTLGCGGFTLGWLAAAFVRLHNFLARATARRAESEPKAGRQVVVMIVFGVLGAVVVGLAALVFVVYNQLSHRRTDVDDAWQQMELQLRRRYDLVPDLVEAVRRFIRRDRQQLDALTVARTAAMHASGPLEKARAESELTLAVRTVVALAEAYPQLSRTPHFSELHAALLDTEYRIANSRQRYNDAVGGYNEAIHASPASVVAGPFGFGSRQPFAVPERTAARVN